VKSGKRYWSDGTPVAGQQFEYAHDDIGNRTSTKAGGDAVGAGLRSASYSVNSLNEHINRTVPGAVDVLGAAKTTASVTVNSAAVTTRKGEYYWKELSVANGSTPVWQSVSVTATEGANNQNSSGNLFVPQTPEVFVYDADGNLTTNGQWVLTWDGENRLTRMVVNTAVGPQQRIDFEYDWQGRRIAKKVWNDTAGTSGPKLSERFLYDGWNLISQLNATNNAVVRSYLWGTDLSSTMQGAGGVGGLLAVSDTANGTHFATYDGNGNVMALVSATDSSISARYEFGPFGELIRATDPLAFLNPFRFSTKYQDDETGFLYYGYRYYDPSTGRWPSRDPIEERGGINLYLLGSNDSVNKVDPLGLDVLPKPDQSPRLFVLVCRHLCTRGIQTFWYYCSFFVKAGPPKDPVGLQNCLRRTEQLWTQACRSKRAVSLGRICKSFERCYEVSGPGVAGPGPVPIPGTDLGYPPAPGLDTLPPRGGIF
jgi:RHS repeat-associated protein